MLDKTRMEYIHHHLYTSFLLHPEICPLVPTSYPPTWLLDHIRIVVLDFLVFFPFFFSFFSRSSFLLSRKIVYFCRIHFNMQFPDNITLMRRKMKSFVRFKRRNANLNDFTPELGAMS